MESRSRLEIREWSYDNLDLVSPGESKKNNSQSRLEKLYLLSRVRVKDSKSKKMREKTIFRAEFVSIDNLMCVNHRILDVTITRWFDFI